jgi:hypothetical protein
MRIFEAEEIFECMHTDLSILIEKHENEDLHMGAYKGPFRVRQRLHAHDPLGTYICPLRTLNRRSKTRDKSTRDFQIEVKRAKQNKRNKRNHVGTTRGSTRA